MIQYEICVYLADDQNHRFLTTNKQHFRSIRNKIVMFDFVRQFSFNKAIQSGLLKDKPIRVRVDNLLSHNRVEDALNHGMKINTCTYSYYCNGKNSYACWSKFIAHWEQIGFITSQNIVSRVRLFHSSIVLVEPTNLKIL